MTKSEPTKVARPNNRGGASAKTRRIENAVESFKSAAITLGPLDYGCAVFAVTRGQFSMVDAIQHCIAQCGEPVRISLWTWTIADYEATVFARLVADGRIADGVLVIDEDARARNAPMLRRWQTAFGEASVRYVINHAKVATIEGVSPGGKRLLLRGSLNLNHNPRFEQMDVSEGCPGFDLVRGIEAELPVLPFDATCGDAHAASRTGEAFNLEELSFFKGVRGWRK